MKTGGQSLARQRGAQSLLFDLHGFIDGKGWPAGFGRVAGRRSDGKMLAVIQVSREVVTSAIGARERDVTFRLELIKRRVAAVACKIKPFGLTDRQEIGGDARRVDGLLRRADACWSRCQLRTIDVIADAESDHDAY